MSREGIEPARSFPSDSAGGRTRWAHIELDLVIIELTIVKKEFEELMNVKGIGEKSFLKLKPLITVGDAKPASRE